MPAGCDCTVNDEALPKHVNFCAHCRFVIFFLAIIACGLICPVSVFAQSTADRSDDWILYERGNAMFAQGEYGRALQLYKEAVSAAGIFPEAEIGIGDVFFEEGELQLAREQYEKAYGERNAFRIADAQYEVLYKLADLYQNENMYNRMEDALSRIVADDKKYSDAESARLKAQIEKNYTTKGIDHTLFLYQFDVPFAQVAHSRLGLFYYRSGRYEQAIVDLLYSVIYNTSEINSALHSRDVDYQFTTLSGMLTAVQGKKDLAQYVADSSLFRDLYYLAGASYAAGYPAHATQIWKLVASSTISGSYAALSARQLKAPWIEKVLGPGRGGNY
jgi:tetratricopeptide (TPR) repeat protein